MAENLSGIADLHAKRARRARQAPPPRHPKTPATSAAAVPTAPQPQAQTPRPTADNDNRPAQTPSPTAPENKPAGAAGAQTVPAAALPILDVDLTDPAAHLVSPTVLSVPASIVERFDHARRSAPSHTALVLDALRAHAEQLPALILERRPAANPQDLFPWRATPGTPNAETVRPLRIRPTHGELAVMKTLTDWASTEIAHMRPGSRPTNRSEMITAALAAYLPQLPKRKGR